MRGVAAKRLRRSVYGVDFSPRERRYSIQRVKAWKRIPSPKDQDKFDWVRIEKPVIHADPRRKAYQKLKREHYA